MIISALGVEGTIQCALSAPSAWELGRDLSTGQSIYCEISQVCLWWLLPSPFRTAFSPTSLYFFPRALLSASCLGWLCSIPVSQLLEPRNLDTNYAQKKEKKKGVRQEFIPHGQPPQRQNEWCLSTRDREMFGSRAIGTCFMSPEAPRIL
jgi:hypothetical protein